MKCKYLVLSTFNKMSVRHLSKGSELPPKTGNKIRLYSMQFCPYAQRARIVLLAKNIPHEIVNINLQEKPEWVFELNDKGKVPILDVGSKVIAESMDICEYLEELYPEPALHPKSIQERERNKDLLEKYNELIMIYYKAVRNTDGKKMSEYLEAALPLIKIFEEELVKRGAYFHGSQPGMLDYMVWPWIERLPVLRILHNDHITIPNEHAKNLKQWRLKMLEQKPIKETFTDLERHAKVCQLIINPTVKLNVDEI